MPLEDLITVNIFGEASKSVVKTFDLSAKDRKNIVMYDLFNQDIPIASSCLGEGQCLKCVINDDAVSCQITWEELIQPNIKQVTIRVRYL